MEFALVLPLLLIAFLAMAEVVVVARTQLELAHAAREGAREAAANPDVERAIGAVRRSLEEATAGHVRVAVQRDRHVGGAAKVTASLEHRIAAPLFGGFRLTLTSSAVMRVEK